MPGIVMDLTDLPRKKSSRALSPQSPQSDSLDLAIDGAIIDTSIDQLYCNVYEMQSSDQSPSRASFFSYGEESMIDFELRHLVGDLGDVEVTKQVVVENNNSDEPSLVGKETDQQHPKTKVLKTRSLRPKPSLKAKPLRPRDQNPDLGGEFWLKQAKDMVNSGENPHRTLEVAQRAMSAFEEEEEAERPSRGKARLGRVMSLHVSAVCEFNLGRYEEAVSILERSIEIPAIEDGEDHALAKFSGCMQLGDTYAAAGQLENSLLLYTAGLEIQRQVLGETDRRFGETCRHVAEAHLQAMSFEEAERLCQTALGTRTVTGPGSDPVALLEEAADRRLMGLIRGSMGDHEASLEHYLSAAAALAPLRGQELAAAFLDRSLGDAYLALSRYDEAGPAYERALSVFKALRGENRPEVASVHVRLADLCNKVGRIRESKMHRESALEIYLKKKAADNNNNNNNNNGSCRGTHRREEVATGLVDLSAIYQSTGEFDRALKLLGRALGELSGAPGTQVAAAGIEAQMGVICYMMGRFEDSYVIFKSSVSKFRASAEKKTALFGFSLNQMGLACVQLYSINEAAELFEEAKCVLEKECGPFHHDTLGVYSNLAGTYDAMGRIDEAIEILEYVVGMREEKLGTASPEVDDEKRRLGELLKETGRGRNRKPRSLETLLDNNNAQT